ncbi:MAG TPA: type II toxin-antitoxin system PemK/MazF family toxin [Mycobacteriales bacterium]|nr:type II toxin-antitoxin system PemK/MazF family toxin [Mycobacteriales bacterium]
MTARRGEVWEYAHPDSGKFRVVVVSNDVQNDIPGAWPLCVLVTRRTPSVGIPAFTVELADPDPLGGVVLTATVRGLDPAGLVVPLGMVTGATMTRISAALKDLFELS